MAARTPGSLSGRDEGGGGGGWRREEGSGKEVVMERDGNCEGREEEEGKYGEKERR